MQHRRISFSSLLAPWAGLALAGVVGSARAEEAEALFRDRVQPLLATRCVTCHGPEKQKGNLRLDSRDAALKGGDLGPSIVPGRPADSLLLQAVAHAKPDLEMPPKDKLMPAEIQLLEAWILAGAPWTTTAAEPLTASATHTPERVGDAWSDPRNPITRIFAGQRLDLWSLRPLQRPAPPPVPASRGAAPSHPVDRFVQARLAQEGLPSSPPADRRTLARRLTVDLTGLPPTAEELRRFEADSGADAYERLVERLLASPRYGEHQARLWLDVVRYSDSNGFDWDEFRPEAWRFRDYVVRSFNRDKPFPQFIREQLAGDELVDGPPQTEADQDALVATGYLRIGPQDNSAPLFNEQGRARAEWLADLTETTGSAFLGLTLACCRCHDHKYDPLSQADHFRLRAFFQPVKYGDDLALDLAPVQAEIREQHARLEREADPARARRAVLLAAAKNRLRGNRVAALPEEERRLLAATTDPQPQDFEKLAAGVAKKIEPTDDEARKAFNESERDEDKILAEQIKSVLGRKRPFTRALLATDNREPPPPTRIHFQGDPAAERASVEPGFPSVLDPNPAVIPAAPNSKTLGRRLALADWIASPANPLTARVFVNRAWQSMFGRGLVGTPNDFGLAGARPTHPELLDWLASEFLAQGGSVKHILRLIATSDAYRQSSAPRFEAGVAAKVQAADGDNRLLWRQNLRRLTAEQLRDAMIAVSGGLQLRAGGPPIWPELPAEVLQANPAFLDDNPEKTKGWYPSPRAERSVRSFQLVQKRTVRVPFLETFDLPENSTSCPLRTVSIVAPQALSLLNGAEALEAAEAFAERVRSEAGQDRTLQVQRAFAHALQRAPQIAEQSAAERYLATASLIEFCRALLNINEFAYVD